MRVVIYGRVSTLAQAERESDESQLRQLREFVAAQPRWILVHEHVDHASGLKNGRTEFRRLFADAADKKFDLVLFWALDRFSREGTVPTLKYLEQLSSLGVGWKSLTEQYLDSTGIWKDAIIAIVATVARQESIRRGERVKAGHARVKATTGEVPGPKRAKALDLKDILQRRKRKQSYRLIATALGCSVNLIRHRIKQASAPSPTR